jgi:PAS domain S-box-containing protein
MVAAVDRDRRFLIANRAVARFLGFDAPEEIIGKTDFELLPGAASQGMLKRLKAIDEAVMASGKARAIEFETEMTPVGDGARAYISNKAPMRDPKTGEVVGLVNIIHDITERRRAERRLRRLFDSSVVGVIFWNLQTSKITDANEAFLAMVGYSREDLEAGRLDFRAMTPPEWTERNEQGVAALLSEGYATAYEKEYFRKDGSRVPILIGGTRFDDSEVEGYSYILDISERKRIEERQRFLVDLSERTRAILDPDTVAWETVRAVGEYLRVTRCSFIETDDSADTLILRRDWTREDTPSVAGTFPTASFGKTVIDELRAGRTLIIRDAAADPRLEEDSRVAFAAVQARALVNVPVVKAGRWVGTLAVNNASPRQWSPQEVELIETVAERMWLAVENARLFRETRRRAEREALINRIGETVRAALEPEEVLRAAVKALGAALDADRCYYVTYDLSHDCGKIEPDWYREGAGLASIRGEYRMSDYTVNRAPQYKSGQTQVIDDVQKQDPPLSREPGDKSDPARASLMEELGLRSLIRAPLQTGDIMTALVVSMASGPRHWTSDEVRLVETIAAQTRAAVESTRIQQRERNISRQLQAALQPDLPERVPGMLLRGFYRAALEEAGVGGDFTDVFSIKEGAFTCFVVSDLSGKGLAAAREVATVRNMLRYALHSGTSLAASVGQLNQVLAEQNLLNGFATLFVGTYHAESGVLTYVNCGQEPGLIWRSATGVADCLIPTGPVLGGFADGAFTEETILLAPGDVLALFTDGMTEAGPSRRDLLEIEGLKRLFESACAACSADDSGRARSGADAPRFIVQSMIAGVESYAGGASGLRDDIALLVGVVPSDSKNESKVGDNG